MSDVEAEVYAAAAELLEHLKVLSTAVPTAEAIQRTTNYCEAFQTHPLAYQTAKLVLNEPGSGRIERLYALHLLEIGVRTYAGESGLQSDLLTSLSNSIRQDLNTNMASQTAGTSSGFPSGGVAGIPVVVEDRPVLLRASRVLSELALREFPQKWPEMMQDLLQFASISRPHCQLVMLMLKDLCEECVDSALNSRISPQRRSDILQSLSTTSSVWCFPLLQTLQSAVRHLDVPLASEGEELWAHWYGVADVKNAPAFHIFQAGLQAFSTFCSFMPPVWLRDSGLLDILGAVWTSITRSGEAGPTATQMLDEVTAALVVLADGRRKVDNAAADAVEDTRLLALMRDVVSTSDSTSWSGPSGHFPLDYDRHFKPVACELFKFSEVVIPRLLKVSLEASTPMEQSSWIRTELLSTAQVAHFMVRHPSLQLKASAVNCIVLVLRHRDIIKHSWFGDAVQLTLDEIVDCCIRPTMGMYWRFAHALASDDACTVYSRTGQAGLRWRLTTPVMAPDAIDAAFEADFPSPTEWEYLDMVNSLRNACVGLIDIRISRDTGICDELQALFEAELPVLFATQGTNVELLTSPEVRRLDGLCFVTGKMAARAESAVAPRLKATIAQILSSPITSAALLTQQIALLEACVPLLEHESNDIATAVQFLFGILGAPIDPGSDVDQRLSVFVKTRATQIISQISRRYPEAMILLFQDVFSAVSATVSSGQMSAFGEVALCETVAKIGSCLPASTDATQVFDLLTARPLAFLDSSPESYCTSGIPSMAEAPLSTPVDSLLAFMNSAVNEQVSLRILASCVRAYQTRQACIEPVATRMLDRLASLLSSFVSLWSDSVVSKIVTPPSSPQDVTIALRQVYTVDEKGLTLLLRAAQGHSADEPEHMGGVESIDVWWNGEGEWRKASIDLDPHLRGIAAILPEWYATSLRSILTILAELALLPHACVTTAIAGEMHVPELLRTSSPCTAPPQWATAPMMRDLLNMFEAHSLPLRHWVVFLRSFLHRVMDLQCCTALEERRLVEQIIQVCNAAWNTVTRRGDINDALSAFWSCCGLPPASCELDEEAVEAAVTAVSRDTHLTIARLATKLVCSDTATVGEADETGSTHAECGIRLVRADTIVVSRRAFMAFLQTAEMSSLVANMTEHASSLADPQMCREVTRLMHGLVAAIDAANDLRIMDPSIGAQVDSLRGVGDNFFQRSIEHASFADQKDHATQQCILGFATQWYYIMCMKLRITDAPMSFISSIPGVTEELLAAMHTELESAHTASKREKAFRSIFHAAAATAKDIQLLNRKAENVFAVPERTVASLQERLVIEKAPTQDLLDDDETTGALSLLFGP